MKQGIGLLVTLAAVIVGLILLSNAAYLVYETDQVIITQFGAPVGEPVLEPGLHFKTPFIQKAQRFDKRFLAWDGDRNQLPTKDKRFIWVDTYARWQIIDPLQFFKRLRDERGAQSRLDDILDGETRNTIARHALIEVVRDSNREFTVVEELGDAGSQQIGSTNIASGRTALEAEVLKAAQTRVEDLGLRVLDFRFKRINYVAEVQAEVYNRMISERQRIAEQFRSEGAGEAARIKGEKLRELKKISSEAYRKAQEIKGTADATAADVYAKAYNRDPDFYRFLKSMDVLKATMDDKTYLLLSTDGDLTKYLQEAK